jgi:hypothetical protein
VLEGWDDDQLLAALGEAIRARQDVPDAFVEMGKGAYAWHHIDAELALLTYDSSRAEDRDVTASMRSETASIRALTFTSAHLSLELEVTGDSLLGQIIPPRPGTLDTQTPDGATASTDVDEIGCFAVTPIPASPFRLRCRTADGTDVLTGWISLLAILLLALSKRRRWPAGQDRLRLRAGRRKPTRRGSGRLAGTGADPPSAVPRRGRSAGRWRR